MAKTVIVMASPHKLWSKPTWCWIWKNTKRNTTSVLMKQPTWPDSSTRRFGHQPMWWYIPILKIHITTTSVVGSKPTWWCIFNTTKNVSLTSMPGLNRHGGWLHNVNHLIDVMFENIQHRLHQRRFGSRR